MHLSSAIIITIGLLMLHPGLAVVWIGFILACMAVAQDQAADRKDDLPRRCEQAWNTCYPDRRPWSEIGADAQAEWVRVFGIFDEVD